VFAVFSFCQPTKISPIHIHLFTENSAMHTKTRIHPSHRLGFTLVEILVVIAIIMVLAAMTISGLGYYNNKVATSKTLVLMGGIETALEQYRADVGEYPQETCVNPISSTAILYKELYGDRDKDGVPDVGATVYLSLLDPNFTRKNSNLRWQNGKLSYVIADGWGGQMAYRCIQEGSSELMNPPSSFDLWSSGGKGSVRKKTTINNWK